VQPKASAAATFASGLIECGLYLNHPKRKSVSSVVLIACRIRRQAMVMNDGATA